MGNNQTKLARRREKTYCNARRLGSPSLYRGVNGRTNVALRGRASALRAEVNVDGEEFGPSAALGLPVSDEGLASRRPSLIGRIDPSRVATVKRPRVRCLDSVSATRWDYTSAWEHRSILGLPQPR